MIKTRRWNDPREDDDGFRLLVSRYRPRGVRSEEEPWNAWMPQLGPSVALHAAYYGKAGAPISWEEYAPRYLAEMEGQVLWIGSLAAGVGRGETLTLLCSSACVDASRCHRTLLASLIERRARPEAPTEAPSFVVRRTRAGDRTPPRAGKP